MMSIAGDRLRGLVARIMARLAPPRAVRFGSLSLRLAQKYAEATHSRSRRALLKMDQRLGQMLAFSGSPE